jgi:hypothetical protein
MKIAPDGSYGLLSKNGAMTFEALGPFANDIPVINEPSKPYLNEIG